MEVSAVGVAKVRRWSWRSWRRGAGRAKMLEVGRVVVVREALRVEALLLAAVNILLSY